MLPAYKKLCKTSWFDESIVADKLPHHHKTKYSVAAKVKLYDEYSVQFEDDIPAVTAAFEKLSVRTDMESCWEVNTAINALISKAP